MNKFKQEGALFCLQPEVLETQLFSSWKLKQDYIALDIALVPCASKVELFDGSNQGAEDNCVWDEDQVKSYMTNSFDFMIFHNQLSFVPN